MYQLLKFVHVVCTVAFFVYIAGVALTRSPASWLAYVT